MWKKSTLFFFEGFPYNSLNELDDENFSENENALIYGDNISEHLMFISCMASKEDGSQSWIFFEKTLIISYSKTPKRIL